MPKQKRSKTTIRLNNNILKGYKHGVWKRHIFIHQHGKEVRKNHLL